MPATADTWEGAISRRVYFWSDGSWRLVEVQRVPLHVVHGRPMEVPEQAPSASPLLKPLRGRIPNPEGERLRRQAQRRMK